MTKKNRIGRGSENEKRSIYTPYCQIMESILSEINTKFFQKGILQELITTTGALGGEMDRNSLQSSNLQSSTTSMNSSLFNNSTTDFSALGGEKPTKQGKYRDLLEILIPRNMRRGMLFVVVHFGI